MNGHALSARTGTVLTHFVRTRALEVLALQASPLFGLLLGDAGAGQVGVLRPALLILGSLALTAHIFVFNDWAGYPSDLEDRHRFPHQGAGPAIQRHEWAWIAAVFLLLAYVFFLGVGLRALGVGVAITALSLLYSFSPRLGKSTPIAASINHVLGGGLHFLLGYTLTRPPDMDGLLLGLFFGLVFAAGHLNQEIRDHDGDRAAGIRTSAVVFGRHKTFFASTALFTAAYGLVVGLALADILPGLAVWSGLLLPVHLVWTRQALLRGLDATTALWMQRRYRLLFGIIGLLLATTC